MIALVLAFLIFVSTAFSSTLYYPGTFDPLHRVHIEEVTHALENCRLRDPGCKVKVLPIEKAYYHRNKGGMFRPSLFPFTLKRKLIQDSFSSDPAIEVSEELREISSSVFDSLIHLIDPDRHPDDSLLIGSDVLEIWSSATEFEAFSSRIHVVVSSDPTRLLEVNFLKQKFNHLHFYDWITQPLRSKQIILDLFRNSFLDHSKISQSEIKLEFASQLAQDTWKNQIADSFRDWIVNHPVGMEKLKEEYCMQLSDYEALDLSHGGKNNYLKELEELCFLASTIF